MDTALSIFYVAVLWEDSEVGYPLLVLLLNEATEAQRGYIICSRPGARKGQTLDVKVSLLQVCACNHGNACTQCLKSLLPLSELASLGHSSADLRVSAGEEGSVYNELCAGVGSGPWCPVLPRPLAQRESGQCPPPQGGGTCLGVGASA